MTAFQLVLAGCLKPPTTVLEDAIVSRMRQEAPTVRASRTPHEPIAGVLMRGLTSIGASAQWSVLDRLMPAIAP